SVIQVAALGLGMTALLLLTLVRGDLLSDWRSMTPADAPNRFVINIQPDQRAALEDFFVAEGLARPGVEPMIRGRMLAINGEAVKPDSFEDTRTRRLAAREFNLSYSSALPEGNEIIDGQWHGAGETAQFSV